MKQQIIFLSALFGALLFSCQEKPASEPAGKTFDFTIVPGERVGLITKDSCTREFVLAAYGDSAKVDSIYLIDGMFGEGVVLFPDNPRHMATVWWDTDNDPSRPAMIRIRADETAAGLSDWKTDGGLGIGSSIEEVERQNGKAFELWGFGWDYGGRVTDWKSGKFEGTGTQMIFDLPPDAYSDSLSGEIQLNSADPAVRKAKAAVVAFEMRFPLRMELPTCIAEKVKATAAEAGVLNVWKMTIDGQDHYWFNDGAAAYDGIEYIYDSNCKEVCQTGGFRLEQPKCGKLYEQGKWQPVWEER